MRSISKAQTCHLLNLRWAAAGRTVCFARNKSSQGEGIAAAALPRPSYSLLQRPPFCRRRSALLEQSDFPPPLLLRLLPRLGGGCESAAAEARRAGQRRRQRPSERRQRRSGRRSRSGGCVNLREVFVGDGNGGGEAGGRERAFVRRVQFGY